MSFLKSFLLAILACLLLTFVFGGSFLSLFDGNIIVNGELIEPLAATSVTALVTLFLVVIALGIFFSVCGSLICLTIMFVVGVTILAVGFFWPVLLLAMVIWLMSRNKHNNQFA